MRLRSKSPTTIVRTPSIEVEAAKVLTFYPNLLGYLRIVLLLASFCYLHSNHRRALLLYGISFFLDVLDGPLARYMNQQSRYGALLDMMTDKFSTPSLLNALSTRHDSLAPIFVACLVLDMASHIFHLQATAMSGVRSHKDTSSNFVRWKLVRWFYSVKPFFMWTCIGHELFIIGLYWLSWEKSNGGDLGPIVIPSFSWDDSTIIATAISVSATSTWIDFLSLILGGPGSKGIRLCPLLTLLCLPSWLCKTAVHAAQLCSAGETIAIVDAVERRAAEQCAGVAPKARQSKQTTPKKRK